MERINFVKSIGLSAAAFYIGKTALQNIVITGKGKSCVADSKVFLGI